MRTVDSFLDESLIPLPSFSLEVFLMDEIKRLEEIISEIDVLISRYSDYLRTRGANCYFALQRLQSAREYLEREIRLIEKL